MLEKAADWIGRKVRIFQGAVEDIGKEGVVLAIDGDPFRTTTWIKVDISRWSPTYLTVPLWWLEDIETGEQAPQGTRPLDIKPDSTFKDWQNVEIEDCTVHGDGSQIREINGGVKDWVHFGGRTVEFAGGAEPPTQSYSSNNSGSQIRVVNATNIMDNGDGTFTSY